MARSIASISPIWSDRPSDSVMQAMVLAVPITAQVPAVDDRPKPDTSLIDDVVPSAEVWVPMVEPDQVPLRWTMPGDWPSAACDSSNCIIPAGTTTAASPPRDIADRSTWFVR